VTLAKERNASQHVDTAEGKLKVDERERGLVTLPGTQWLAIWSMGSKWVVSEVAGKAGRGCVDSSLVTALNQCTVTLIDPKTRAQCLPYEQRDYHELFINSLLSV
jgi:hypothetical protein